MALVGVEPICLLMRKITNLQPDLLLVFFFVPSHFGSLPTIKNLHRQIPHILRWSEIWMINDPSKLLAANFSVRSHMILPGVEPGVFHLERVVTRR